MALPSLQYSEYAHWTKEKDSKTCALDMQGKKVGFGSWYNCQYGDYTCEEYYARKDNIDQVRTVDLTPEDRLNRDLNDDDSLKGSDWRGRTGQPLLRLGAVASNLKPNRKKAMIYFKGNDNKFLPTAYVAEEHRRTVDQMMSFLGQTNFGQGHVGNQSTPERLKNSGNKRK